MKVTFSYFTREGKVTQRQHFSVRKIRFNVMMKVKII